MEEMYRRNVKGSRESLRAASVLIAGAGGIGSNLAVSLSRTGIGKLVIVDFDRVEASNLNRQAYRYRDIGRKKVEALREIIEETGSDSLVEAFDEKITEENIGRFLEKADIICECADRAETKAMICENALAAGKMVICSSGMAGTGRGNRIKSRRRLPKLYIAGDMESDYEEVDGMMAPQTQICAGHMADIVVTGIIKKRRQ